MSEKNTNCICDPAQCTSCFACIYFCHKHKLKSIEKESGFKYVGYKEETDNLCFCHFQCPQRGGVIFHDYPKAYAIQLKNKEKLLVSTSGGMFFAAAQYVFSRQGVVFGAIYSNHLQVKHFMAENEAQLAPMHGSKYVQSDMSDCYEQLQNQLDNKRLVLFSGLPCQVAGVYAYLGKNYDNLITLDLICSGVPSQKLFNQYIEYIEKIKRIKIIDYKFRDKNKYGLSHTVVITYKTKFNIIKTKTIKHRETVSYYVAFGKQNCFMDSCYNCKYNCTRRISDITMGGFWSIGRTNTKMNKYNGISLALSNTQKGENVIKHIRSVAYVEEYPLDIAVISNAALTDKTPLKLYDTELYTDLSKRGYKYTAKKHFKRKSNVAIACSHIYHFFKS